MEIETIGIDLGKTVFHVVGVDALGKSRGAQAMFSESVIDIFGECASRTDRHGGLQWIAFLARALREQGHDVRLMPAQYVKPYVKTNKSDYG